VAGTAPRPWNCGASMLQDLLPPRSGAAQVQLLAGQFLRRVNAAFAAAAQPLRRLEEFFRATLSGCSSL